MANLVYIDQEDGSIKFDLSKKEGIIEFLNFIEVKRTDPNGKEIIGFYDLANYVDALDIVVRNQLGLPLEGRIDNG